MRWLFDPFREWCKRREYKEAHALLDELDIWAMDNHITHPLSPWTPFAIRMKAETIIVYQRALRLFNDSEVHVSDPLCFAGVLIIESAEDEWR